MVRHVEGTTGGNRRRQAGNTSAREAGRRSQDPKPRQGNARDRGPDHRLGWRQGSGDGVVSSRAASRIRRSDCGVAGERRQSRGRSRLPRPYRAGRLRLRFQGAGFRAHDPKWAFSPLSGDGAKAKGGRFNPIGVSALYLSLTLEGMFLEMGHGLAHRFEPLTICSYEIDVDDITDLRAERARTAAGVALPDMACA